MLAFGQDTLARMSSTGLGSGLAGLVHERPFHDSVRVASDAPCSPAATQLAALKQDTPSSSSKPLLGLRLLTGFQAVPFQVSVRVCVALPAPWRPTARQLLALAQDTPLRMSKALLGLGLDACFQVLPFHDSVSVAVSTLITAALFNPLRRRVQHAVDRRFNRSRYNAEAVVAAFTARLRHSVELDVVQGDLMGVVDEAVQPTRVSIWLTPGPP